MRSWVDHMVCWRSGYRRKLETIAVHLAVLGSFLSTPLQSASASTEVRGHLDEMQVQSENAPVKEVLDALSAKFKLRYRMRADVGRVLSGLYTGTLRQVLSRVLDGNDYILNISDDGVEVTVLGASQTPGMPSPALAGATRDNPIVATTPAPNAPPPLSSFLSR
jgi:hypothetical protein